MMKFFFRLFVVLAAAGLGLVPSSRAEDVDYTWANGTSGGNWSVPANWTFVGIPPMTAVPTDGDQVFFVDPAGTVITNMDASFSFGANVQKAGLRRLDFGGGASYQVNLSAPLIFSNAGNPGLYDSQIRLGGTASGEINLTTGNGIGTNTNLTFLNESTGDLRILQTSASSLDIGAFNLTLTLTNSGRMVIDTPITGTTGGNVTVNAGSSIVTFGVNAVNSYTGLTTVASGTLNVLGNTQSIQYQVNAGARLTGIGTVGDVVVNGTIEAGNSARPLGPPDSIATLTVNGDLLMNAGSTYVWELANAAGGTAGTDWDLVNIPDKELTVQVAGTKTITIDNFDAGWSHPQGRSYKIIGVTAGVLQSTADLFILAFGAGGSAAWNGYSIDNFFLEGRADGLYLVEIPEWDMALAACGVVGMAAFFQRRRRLAPVNLSTLE